MIIVTIKTSQDKVVIKSQGHSGYAEKGNDIVCAAVSALVFTVVAFFDHGRDNLEITSCDVLDDMINLIFLTKDLKMRSAVEFFETGIGLLAEKFPDNVRLVTQHTNSYFSGYTS